MKKSKKRIVSHILNVVTIAFIEECCLCALMAVRLYARGNCFERIEETTEQMSLMFNHAMNERLDKLTVFADILVANQENPKEILQTYMDNFCKTQYFSAVCIHRADGSSESCGAHPHGSVTYPNFDVEVARLPYVSDIFTYGVRPEQNFIYQAVPIIRSGETVAILYGYTSLDVLPTFLSSSAYDGECEFYVVDGNTGRFLMDEYHGVLNNIYDGSLGEREVKSGYSLDEMRNDVKNGRSGYFVFRSQRTDEWYYTYYMPMGINNWSMQITIDEPTALASYNSMSMTMLILMVCDRSDVPSCAGAHAAICPSQPARQGPFAQD